MKASCGGSDYAATPACNRRALTRDHTQVQELVDRGILTPEQARVSTRRNFLSRALGTFSDVEIDRASHRPEPGDVYLLCSDGLTNMVDDAEIAAIIRASATLDAAAASYRPTTGWASASALLKETARRRLRRS